MIFNVSSVKILLLVLVCLYHVYYIIYLCLKTPVWTMQCQLNKAKSGIFLRSYRMCWNRGEIGKISTDIRNSELGSIWKYSFTLKPINLLPEKTCWNLDQSAAEKRPCATQWLVWLNKEPEAISFSSWLQQGWLWHRMWRERVKSLQKNSWSSEEQQKKPNQKTNPTSLRTVGFLRKSVW